MELWARIELRTRKEFKLGIENLQELFSITQDQVIGEWGGWFVDWTGTPKSVLSTQIFDFSLGQLSQKQGEGCRLDQMCLVLRGDFFEVL